MSFDSKSSSTLFRKKALKSTLSQSDNYPYSRYSLKDRPQQSLINNRRMSVSEEHSGDILTDLSSLPYIPHKEENNKQNRRFSELKPSLTRHTQRPTNSERRNSTPQISFSSLLPNPFRSNKHHHHKNTPKDETNTIIDTPNSTFALFFNDTMATKTEPISSSKILNTNINGSRTNLSISSEHSSTYSHEDSASSLFILDSTHSEPRSADTFMLELNAPLCVAEIYREHFFEYFHTNYCGEFQQEGLFIASLRYFYTKSSDNTTCQARAIIRIPSRNYDVSVVVDGTNEDNILQVLFNKAHLSAIDTCKPIGDPKANEKIYLFDKSNDERQNCKVGFIYQRLNQTDEYDIFNNDNISNDMNDFLQILADRIRLKGFEKYRGDLDVKNDLHGEYSYYTQYNHHEIMFNIAPMIPSAKTNGQCVQRKGLVGNSFVCVVFQESDAEFLPDFISGKVTQIYITVKPIKINEQVYYKIGIWHRNDLTSLIDPPGGIYECDKSFRDYFLTLLLNSINVAIESPSLRFCISEQRQRLKQEELKKLSLNLCIGQVLDITSDADNTNSHVDLRTNSRYDGFLNATAHSTNDSVVPNFGRTSPVPTKKRTISKILGVFTSRSGSISGPSYVPNNDSSTNTPLSPEVNIMQNRTVISSNKEPVRRAASVKHRPAPSPPGSRRIPVSYTRSVAPTQSSNLPVVSSHSSVTNSFSSTNENLPSQNNLFNTSAHDETLRNRSISSPGDNVNPTTKRPLSTVSSASKEISDTSSIEDFSDAELTTDEEKNAHRLTLTETPLLLPLHTNS